MWQQLQQPSALRLVELGPGRGTLMADLLRSTAAFPAFASSLSVSLVEVGHPNAVLPVLPGLAQDISTQHACSLCRALATLPALSLCRWHAWLTGVGTHPLWKWPRAACRAK